MKKHRGFTLIELLIAIAILAIVLGLAVPGFQETIRNNRATTVTNDLVAALNFARSEAIRRGVDVTVCASDNQATCSGTWNNGWVVRAGGAAVRVWPAVRAGGDVNGPATIVFEAIGSASSGDEEFDIDFNGADRCVQVAGSGRISSLVGVCPP